MSARTTVVALLCGAGFGAGLALSGLAHPQVIIGFLDVTGRWDPTLAVVMAVALAVNATAVAAGTRAGRPFWGRAFVLPTWQEIDRRLLVGSALFGIGWGLAGACPGPALTSVASGATSVLAFVAAMTAGTVLVDGVARRALSRQHERSQS